MEKVKRELLIGTGIWFGSAFLGLLLYCAVLSKAGADSQPGRDWVIIILFATLNTLLNDTVRLVNNIGKRTYAADAPAVWKVSLSFLSAWGAAAITTGTTCKLFSVLTGLMVPWRTLTILSALYAGAMAFFHCVVRSSERNEKRGTVMKTPYANERYGAIRPQYLLPPMISSVREGKGNNDW